jgi:hypothetical protein
VLPSLAGLLFVVACEPARPDAAPPAPQTQPSAKATDERCKEFKSELEVARDTDRTIVLRDPLDVRLLELPAEGVTMSFGFDDAVLMAHCLELPLAVEFFAKRPERERLIRLTGDEDRQVHMVTAALLDLGRVRVVESGATQAAESVVRTKWTFIGCAGDCRHSGREYRVQIPGEAFYRITDQIAHRRRSP